MCHKPCNPKTNHLHNVSLIIESIIRSMEPSNQNLIIYQLWISHIWNPDERGRIGGNYHRNRCLARDWADPDNYHRRHPLHRCPCRIGPNWRGKDNYQCHHRLDRCLVVESKEKKSEKRRRHTCTCKTLCFLPASLHAQVLPTKPETQIQVKESSSLDATQVPPLAHGLLTSQMLVGAGASVGLLVGTAVGAIVGSSVGEPVGPSVGVAVSRGWSVGESVGPAVGAGVGNFVGSLVG